MSATARSVLTTLILLVTAAPLIAGCSTGPPREPTVASVNFTPKVILEVNDDGFVWRSGPNTNPGVTVPADNNPPTVEQGTVMDIRNTGRGDHWVQAGKSFDTGTIKPGQSTLVVLSESVTEPKVIEVTDKSAPGHITSLTLLPRPQNS